MADAGPAATAAPAPPDAPPLAPGRRSQLSPSEQTQCLFASRLALAGLVIMLLAQARSLGEAIPLGDQVQHAALVVLFLAAWAITVFVPAVWLRWRTPMFVIFRVALLSLPMLRRPREDAVAGGAHPGLVGALRDLARVIWASRLSIPVGVSISNPLSMLPLVPHIAAQAYSVAAVHHGSAAALCTSPLLRDPLSVARMRRVHGVMQVLAASLPGGVGQRALALFDGPDREARECRAAVGFLCVVAGLLLPVVLLVKTEAAPAEGRPGSGGQPQATGGQAGSCRRLAPEAVLRQLIGRSWLAPAGSGGGEPPVAAWERIFYLLAVLCLSWFLCVAAAGG